MAVFAKAPEPGKVKTRLTPVLHAHEAADLYRALLLDTLEVVESTGAETVVAYAPSAARRALERLLGRRRRLIPQGTGDLGQRMFTVFHRLADGRRPVLLVGSDCPGLTSPRLREAVTALETADVVLGPARDGGYYLVGGRTPRREIFTGIPWSTERVLGETEARIQSAGLALARLKPERDLDTPEDLFEWYAGARTEDLSVTYPRTWAAMHALLPPRRLSVLETTVLGDETGP